MGQTQTLSRLAGWIYGAPPGLLELQDVEELLPCVLRILGQNPGPATLQGTNTYVVGTGPGRILVDTSDGNSYWWPLLQSVLERHGARISEVVLTHQHYDHVGGVPAVQEAFPQARIWKAPSAPEPPEAPLTSGTGSQRTVRRRWFQSGSCCCCDGEAVPSCQPLAAGQTIEAEGVQLQVLLTPGHTCDSACFALAGPAGQAALLTGDTVLGGGIAGRFGDIRAYTASLRRLALQLEEKPLAIYPGHGDPVAADLAAGYVKSLLRALDLRERAVYKLLQRSGACSADEVCSKIYRSTTAASMASEMVQQHLSELVAKGRVRETPPWFWGASTYEAVDESSS